MAITIAQVEKLNKKFKNVEVSTLEKTECGTKADIIVMKYNRFGPDENRISEGLKEVNALWDERQSRPKGYFIAHGYEKENGYCVSVMVTEEWLDNNKLTPNKKVWEETL